MHAISIHVPLAGHDAHRLMDIAVRAAISIHVPLAGHDENYLYVTDKAMISIHVPLAGHDRTEIMGNICLSCHFNPRAPCGARQYL